jgi:hypothetical protein
MPLPKALKNVMFNASTKYLQIFDEEIPQLQVCCHFFLWRWAILQSTERMGFILGGIASAGVACRKKYNRITFSDSSGGAEIFPLADASHPPLLFQ